MWRLGAHRQSPVCSPLQNCSTTQEPDGAAGNWAFFVGILCRKQTRSRFSMANHILERGLESVVEEAILVKLKCVFNTTHLLKKINQNFVKMIATLPLQI